MPAALQGVFLDAGAREHLAYERDVARLTVVAAGGEREHGRREAVGVGRAREHARHGLEGLGRRAEVGAAVGVAGVFDDEPVLHEDVAAVVDGLDAPAAKDVHEGDGAGHGPIKPSPPAPW